MKILSKGIYRNGKIELLEKIPLEEGKEVIVFLPTEEKSEIDLSLLLAQQESLKKIWLDDEDLYGEIYEINN